MFDVRVQNYPHINYVLYSIYIYIFGTSFVLVIMYL